MPKSTHANMETLRKRAGQCSNRQPSGSKPKATMLIKSHGTVRKQVRTTRVRLEIDENVMLMLCRLTIVLRQGGPSAIGCQQGCNPALAWSTCAPDMGVN